MFPSDAERIYTALASTDKTSVAIDSDHYFTTPAPAISRRIPSRNG